MLQKPIVVAFNKKARFNYVILKTYRAGLVLKGWEVKSIKARQLSLVESYVTAVKEQLVWLKANINPLPQADTQGQLLQRSIPLLIKSKELKHIKQQILTQGATMVPLKVMVVKGLIKIDIAVAKGKKLYDKRLELKLKDLKTRQH